MKQEDKDILIKDLCARLPYGVKVRILPDDGGVFGGYNAEVTAIGKNVVYTVHGRMEVFENIKPYLFPMSSMTEEQKEEYAHLIEDWSDETFTLYDESDIVDGRDVYKLPVNYKSIDWLNEHHFDYRGLINKGLAIDATDLNIY